MEKNDEEELLRLQRMAAELNETIARLKGQTVAKTSAPRIRVNPHLLKLIESVRSSRLLRRDFWTPRKLGAGAAVVVLIAGWGVVTSRIESRQGLWVEYFRGTEFNTLYRSRLAKTLEFDWGWGPPLKLWVSDMFSVRLSGFLRVPVDGDYKLILTNDDGARLWLGKKLLIDDWKMHAPETRTVQVSLKKGWYPVRVEYFEQNSSAVLKLRWEMPQNPVDSAIPARYMAPNFESLPGRAEVHFLESAG